MSPRKAEWDALDALIRALEAGDIVPLCARCHKAGSLCQHGLCDECGCGLCNDARGAS